MVENKDLLKAVTDAPQDDSLRLVYADWLEEHGDSRGDFLRLQVQLRALAPDHPHRPALEAELSCHRKGQSADWLIAVEPERAHLFREVPHRLKCGCPIYEDNYARRASYFHLEPQDTECSAWQKLLTRIDDAVRDCPTAFEPLAGMTPLERAQIVTLPQTIARLKSVRRLTLSRTALLRLPAEIGEMENLRVFDPYTSHRLHWFPYEINHWGVFESSVSTRALYGNFKNRLPYPRVGPKVNAAGAWLRGATTLQDSDYSVTRPCSVCRRPFLDRQLHRAWVSLRVGRDVLPLLVNACSEDCLDRVSGRSGGILSLPHRGGVLR
jgi:uncharacterized protein (TIGR02996 family)